MCGAGILVVAVMNPVAGYVNGELAQEALVEIDLQVVLPPIGPEIERSAFIVRAEGEATGNWRSRGCAGFSCRRPARTLRR